MEKILSVSVASYNVEAFIVQNMESFLGTRVSDKIEVLIVDDGSKDNTAKLAAEYQEKYPETIKLISQPNAGPGSTVNTGLKHATGKYFRMVDGDDWVNKDDLEDYIDFLEKNDVDVVYTDYCKVDNETGEQRKEKIMFSKKNKIMQYEDVCMYFNPVMHNVTYKTQILKEHDIKLDNWYYTDNEYLVYPIKYIETIAVLDKLIYMYRVSLATQSMNINSMIKNKAMHELVFKHIFNDMKKAKKKGILSGNKEKVVRRKLDMMAGMQLSIILAQKPCRETKEELRNFVKYLRAMDGQIYKTFIGHKTMKLIRYSGYLLFGTVSKLHRKRTNAD